MQVQKMCQKLLETVLLVQWQLSDDLKKKTQLTKRHTKLRLQLGDKSCSNETRATLYADGWAKGWVGIGAKLHNRFQHHQGGGV